ncbi:hypothetical protein Tco_0496714 [Tanacetum coccineum]
MKGWSGNGTAAVVAAAVYGVLRRQWCGYEVRWFRCELEETKVAVVLWPWFRRVWPKYGRGGGDLPASAVVGVRRKIWERERNKLIRISNPLE